MGQGGSLDTNQVVQALLSHRNNPDPTTNISPANIVFGRDIRDIIPQKSYRPASTWAELARSREASFMKRHFLKAEADKGRSMRKIQPGEHVYVQNQGGNNPRKWSKSGIILECLPYDAYMVKIDGSNSVTKRNRRFLRCFTPFTGSHSCLTAASINASQQECVTAPSDACSADTFNDTGVLPPYLTDLSDLPVTVAVATNTFVKSPALTLLPPDKGSPRGASGPPE